MEGQDRRRVGIFEDDEIPYEVRMKHLIEAYRKDITRLEQLTRYAKGLEEENLLLQKKIKKSEEWLMGNPDKEALIRQMDLEIRFLKGTLTKSFPKRIVELKYIKRKVRDLEEYTLYLQDLLSANDVPYAKREPNESPKVEELNIDDIDIYAVRNPKEDFIVEEQYCYKYPRPSVTADCIVLTKESRPQVLLIERADNPYKGTWAFPGGFMNMDETTEQCAIRELKEETGLEVTDVKQIGTYSTVDRDPRGRTITVAYLVVVESPMEVIGQDDAAKAQWFPIDSLPDLAFDHDEILRDAIALFQ